MEAIYESSFLRMVYFPLEKLLEATWLEGTKMMNKDLYREEMLTYINHYNKYQVDLLLVDEQQLFFKIEPDLQIWVSEIIKRKTEQDVEKLAIVLSEGTAQKLASEQIMKKPNFAHLNTLFFESKEDAKNWLINNDVKQSKRPVLLYNNEYADRFKFVRVFNP